MLFHRSDFKNLLTYDAAFRSHVLKVLKEEHPDFKMKYNISLVKKACLLKIPWASDDLSSLLFVHGCCLSRRLLATYKS
jgi:hypothetical protein